MHLIINQENSFPEGFAYMSEFINDLRLKSPWVYFCVSLLVFKFQILFKKLNHNRKHSSLQVL